MVQQPLLFLLCKLPSRVTASTMTPMTRKMPSIPMSRMGSVVSHESKCSMFFLLCSRAQQGEQQPACNDGSDLARDIDADGIHEQEILVILFQPHFVDHPPAHGERGNARRADHGVELFALRQEKG